MSLNIALNICLPVLFIGSHYPLFEPFTLYWVTSVRSRYQNYSYGCRSVSSVIAIRELCICDAELAFLRSNVAASERLSNVIVDWQYRMCAEIYAGLEWFRSSGYVQHRHVYHREELLAQRMSAITMLTASLVHTRMEHVGHRHVVRIVLPVPLIPFARYLVAQESTRAESPRVGARVTPFPDPPVAPRPCLFRVRIKLGYNDIGVIESGVLSATPSYASEFANCA